MARYHGKGGVVYLGTSDGGAASTVATLRSWALNRPSSKDNVTGFGDANQQYVQSLPDCTGSIDGWWDDTDDNLYDASVADGRMSMYLYPSSLVTGKYWEGQAVVDFSIECPVDGPVAISGDWAAASDWSQH